MPSSNTLDQRTGIKAQVPRIGDFLKRQDNFTHVFVVWEADRRFMAQALPDPAAALLVCREALRHQRASFAPEHGREQRNPTTARLARLDSQVRTCVRALTKSGVEFVLVWQITGQLPEVVFNEGPTGQDRVREVMSALERAVRRSRNTRENRVPGELVHW